MKHTLLTRLFCLALAAVMLLGLLPPAPASAAVTWKETDQAVSVDKRSPIPEFPSGVEDYDPDENVRVSIVLESKPTIQAGFSTRKIGQNAAAMAYNRGLRSEQAALAQAISTRVLGGKKLDVVWNLTLAANLISANVPYGKIEAISRMDGVKAVVRENSYAPCVVQQETPANPQMYAALGMTGAGLTWTSGFTGAGSRIAVIDTGTDMLHQSLDNGAFLHALQQNAAEAGVSYASYLQKLDLLDRQEIASVLSQLNIKAMSPSLTADQLYNSEKHPFAVNYVDGESRRLVTDHMSDDAGDHGSHVAGIAAANRFIPQGSSYAEALALVDMAGTAPDAQLITMKVFGEYSPYDSDFMAAVEDAIYLGCDAVNLSLGTSNPGYGFTPEYQDLLEYMTQTDTVVVASAGNSFSWPEATTYGYLYSDDVSLDTVGSPGSYGSFFSVASVDNDLSTNTAFQVLGNSILYSDGVNAGNYPLSSLDTSTDQSGTEYEYVFVDALGDKADYANVDLRGKVAICSRGNTNFSVKATNAAELGAVATIIYNNEPGLFGMDLLYYDYPNPCAAISQEDADLIRAGSTVCTASNGTQYYTGRITFFGKGALSQEVNPLQSMSAFSSWGVPGDLSLKPEITAPGGNIYSLAGMSSNHNQYQVMSGTSMAAPAVTGMAALMAQYLRQSGLAEQEGLHARTLAQSLLMSTAVPLREENSGGYYYSLLKQGAGLARVDLAVAADSYILVNGQSDGKVKAELGDDPNRTGVYEFSFSINNLTNRTLNYNLSADVFCQDTFNFSADQDPHLLDFWTTTLPAVATFTVGGVPVNPGEDLSAYDLNGDGTTNALDADYLLEYLLENESGLYGKGDVSGDGDVTTYDAHVLLSKLSSGSGLTVPAGGSVTVKARLSLTGAGRDLLERNYANGTYVQAFVHAQSQPTAEGLSGTSHSIPVLAFYGNWTDARMFDYGTVTELSASYDGNLPYLSQLDRIGNTLGIVYGDGLEYVFGGNPYLADEEYLSERNAFSIANGSVISGQYFNLIRNAAEIQTVISNARTGEEYYRKSSGSHFSAYFHVNAGVWDQVQQNVEIGWFGTDAAGTPLSEGTLVDIRVTAIPDYYRNTDGSYDLSKLGSGAHMTTRFTIDNTAPQLQHVAQNGNTLTVQAKDNRHVAAVLLMSENENHLFASATPNQSQANTSVTVDLELPQGIMGDSFLLVICDYAGNETTHTIELDLSENSRPYFTAIDRDSMEYVGLNTDGSLIHMISSGLPARPSAAEYVDGYVFIVTEDSRLYVASDEDLSNPWLIRELDPTGQLQIVNFNDLAYNRADGKLYGQFYSQANGQAYPYLCTIDLFDGTLEVVCQLPEDVINMAIDSRGNFYSAAYSNALLYTYTLSQVTGSNPGMTFVGYMSHYTADPTPMVWDHSTGKLYWAFPGALLEINPQNADTIVLGDCEEDLTGLYIRSDSSSGMFAPVNRVDRVELSAREARLLVNNQLQLDAMVHPWNTANRKVTWSSSNSAVATVDDNGLVTALSAGTVTIRAASAADPGKYAVCTLRVESSIDKTLQAIIWDEEGAVHMSEFSLAGLPSYTKLSNDLADTMVSATVGPDGVIYASSMDMTTGSGSFYRLNAQTYTPTLIAQTYLPYLDMAPAPSMPGNTLAAIYYNYVVLVDTDTGEYYEYYPIFGTNLVGIAYAGTTQYEAVGYDYALVDWYYIIDRNGTVYLMGFMEDNGTYYYMEHPAAPNGIYAQMDFEMTTAYFGSAYYDGEYLYFSAYEEYNDNMVTLYALDTTSDSKTCYTLGKFAYGIWPVVGLMDLNSPYGMTMLDAVSTSQPQAADEAPAPEPASVPQVPARGGLNVAQPQNSGDFDQNSNQITVTLTPPRADTNGWMTLSYNSSELKLVGVSGNTEAFAWKHGSGTVEIAYAVSGTLGDDDAVATVTFEVLKSGEHRFTLLHRESGSDHLGREEYLTVSSGCSHSYTSQDTAPSCEDQGYTTHTCSKCGHTYVDNYKDALGHNHTAVITQPGCESQGYTTYTCTRCGDSYVSDYKSALGHNHMAAVTQPGCESQGYTTHTCSRCGDSYVDSYVEALGHDYGKTECNRCGKASLSTFKSMTCSLGGNISANFYAAVTDELLNNPDAYIQFQYAVYTVKVPVSAGQFQADGQYKGLYKYSCPVNSKQMTMPITAQFFVGDTPVSHSVTRSVEEYAYYIATTSSGKVANLMRSMLNYGAAAQTYFNYNVENLANARLTDEQRELGIVDASAFQHGKSGSADGISLKMATLMMDSETTIRIYYQLTGSKTIDQYTFTVDGKVVTPEYKDGLYFVSVPNIAAHRLDDMHVFTCDGLTAHYCGLSYVNQILKKYSSGPEYDLARAIYRYSEAAENYLVD